MFGVPLRIINGADGGRRILGYRGEMGGGRSPSLTTLWSQFLSLLIWSRKDKKYSKNIANKKTTNIKTRITNNKHKNIFVSLYIYIYIYIGVYI